MSEKIPDKERDRIRSRMLLQKRRLGLSEDGLIEEISRQFGYEEEDALHLDRKTLERFLKNEKRTADATVGIYRQYVESIPEPDPTYEFGDAFADFFGLPDTGEERRAYMARMVELYEGLYDVWDVTDGTADLNQPDWRLEIKPEPYTSFLRATEDESGKLRSRAPFEGVVIPREKELTIFLKEMFVGHEKIYVLRLVDPEERLEPNPPTAFFGNVMEKKLRVEREKEPKKDLTRHFKVLAARVPPDDEDAGKIDQRLIDAAAAEPKWEEDFEEIEEFDDTETGPSQDKK